MWLQHHKQLLQASRLSAAPRATGVPASMGFEQVHGEQEHGEQEQGEQDLDTEPEESEEEIEMIVTEDLIAFFEQSARHRKSLDAFRSANAQPQPAASKESRLARRQRLYGRGPAADVLHCLETDLQLSFDKFTDRLEAQPWPNIPLKL